MSGMLSMIRRWTVLTTVIFILLSMAGPVADEGDAADYRQQRLSKGKTAEPKLQQVAGARLLLDHDYFNALSSSLEGARTEIFISAYLFRTIEEKKGYPEQVLKHLAAAVRRGVRVDVVLERSEDGGDLSRSNAETAERLKKEGIAVCTDAPDRVTHTKLVVIDRRYLLIGSHNLTHAALKFNHEASLFVDSKSLAEEALDYMNSLCSR